MSDAPELQCQRDDCGRYFEVEDPSEDVVRCPHCGKKRPVPDDLPDREQSPASSGGSSAPASGGGQGQAAVDVATEDGTLRLEVHVHVHHHHG